jgi:PAS domain S-box-containing protein
MDWTKHSVKILNALATPVLLIDRNHNILGANQAACRSFNVSIDNIVGKKCFTVAHKLDRPCWHKGTICPAKTALELKKQTKIVHEHNYSGKTVFEQVIASPIFDDHEEVEFIIEEYNDITELIQSKEIVEYLKRDIKTLQGLLPICTKFKKIRDDNGYWSQIESYISSHLDVQFSHGLCEKCIEALYGKEDWYIAIEEKKKNKDKDT